MNTGELAPIFGVEVALAVSQYVGQRSIRHQRYSDCQLDSTLPECMTIGMEPNGFDCSGLVIRSICDALGKKPTDWNPDLRHVRQMAKEMDHTMFSRPELGDIALFGAFVGGENQSHLTVTHAGITVSVKKYGESRMIHAQCIDNRVSNGRIASSGITRYIGKISPAKLAGRAIDS